MEVVAPVWPYLNAVVYGGLAIVVLRQRRRTRDVAPAWLAVTFGVLGATAAVAVLIPADPSSWLATSLIKLYGLGVLGYAYSLFRFMAALEAPPAWLRRTAGAVTAVLAAATVALPRFAAPGAARPVWLQVFVLVFLADWFALSTIVAVRLWHAGAALPSVARRRIRVIGAASGLLALVLLPAASSHVHQSAAVTAVSRGLPLVCAALFLVGFAPPTWLRLVWRHREVVSLRGAEVELMGAITTDEVGEALVPHVARLLGGRGALLVDRHGRVLGASGIPTDEVARLGERLFAVPALPGLVTEVQGGLLALRLDCGALGVQASPYTPYFGNEEVALLRNLGTYADLALGRAELYERAEASRLALEQANADLAASLELRRQMVASVSHELRTPITCITGFASTLSRLWDALAEEERQHFVEKIGHHGVELNDLVDRLLDFSAAEAGRLQARPAPVELREAVDDALERLGPVLEGRPLLVEGESVAVIADPALVRRILTNLLSNAAKYSEDGSAITVRMSVQGEFALVEVQDRGAGLEEEDRRRVFDPFWRAGTAGSRGTGLGLALVKEYVQVMGGTVGVESTVGEGSTFHFSLPVQAVDLRTEAAPATV
ncbi:MAG: HAMP domain-containing histidine kinase [Actinobacteria bacterium]|nr:HAMP domain-containing histidine kinase [Actinomycetota bacterium]